MDEQKFSQCRICVSFCGIEATVRDGRVVKIQPDKRHPDNWRGVAIDADDCTAWPRFRGELGRPALRPTRPYRRVRSHPAGCGMPFHAL